MIDLTGQTFGRLTVLRLQSRAGRVKWQCVCACGQERIVSSDNLRAGRSRSCGSCARTKHGDCVGGRSTPEYETWRNMLQRCYYPKGRHYRNYGGRGITVCERWRTSFSNFLADMGRRPGPNYSIDRIDNDGHYEPGNCRWALRVPQAANKRPGLKHSRARLTPEQVAAIRADDRAQHVIAADYGVSQGHVSHIKRGRFWQEKGRP